MAANPENVWGSDDTPVSKTRMDAARASLAFAVQILTAEKTTREDRARAANDLGQHIDDLAWLAILSPTEWTAALFTLTSAPGFSTQAEQLRRAVTSAANDLRPSIEASAPRKSDVGPDFTVRRQLALTEKGKVKPTYANACKILRLDARWASLRMSSLGDVVEYDGKEFKEGPGTAHAAEWLQDHYGFEGGEVCVKSAVFAIAQGRVYNPVKEYLESIRDTHLQKGRVIDTIVETFLGIKKPTDLQRAMVSRFLIGAVARALNPGCKMETALLLVGEQGAKKSTFFNTLFGEWFGDSPIPIGSKDAPIQMARVWGYEASELEDLTSKRSADSVKQFMATRRDLYRAPFARTAALHPRHTVLCGTTNKATFLTDETGNRRFWILTVPDDWIIKIDEVAAWRDAIWAEALERYEANEPYHFDRADDVLREADTKQYLEEDPWLPIILAWVDGRTAAFTRKDVMADALKLGPDQMDRIASARVGRTLSRLDFKEYPSAAGYRGLRVWMKKAEPLKVVPPGAATPEVCDVAHHDDVPLDDDGVPV